MILGISSFLLRLMDGEPTHPHVEAEILTNAARGIPARNPARKGLDVSSQTGGGSDGSPPIFGRNVWMALALALAADVVALWVVAS